MRAGIAILILILFTSLLFAFPYTDSIGRTVELPDNITRIAPSGVNSQMILYSIAPDMITGWAKKLSDKARDEYFSQDVVNLPVYGTFYGKSANLNKEALMLSNPDVVIDMGEIKGSVEAMAKDLDSVSEITGIPVITIEAYLRNTPEVYRKIGSLLHREERAELLASYAERALETAEKARSMITEPVRVYYSSSDDGLEARTKGSFNAEIIELVGGENVVIPAFGETSANVTLEQLYLWDPEVILLSSEKAYRTVTSSSLWKDISAVSNGRVYIIPSEPYSFIDSPPATNRIIGIYWLGSLLYPDLYDVDLVSEMIEFYKLYYNYDLTEEGAKRILLAEDPASWKIGATT